MKIQDYTNAMARDVTDVFYESVHGIDDAIYSKAQKNAWAQLPREYDSWVMRLMFKQPYVATLGEQVIGFIELDPDGHIDCMYTLPEFQRKGIGSLLYEHLLEKAKEKRMKRLYVEASHVARPFFESKGFCLTHENQVDREGEVITNFTMQLHLQDA
ncbi:GNAT family N-acetyltransferase [Leucothrix sargassi]|nr:GNAT family N-acetyltransferase [Leucothrix sargassi]